MTEYWYEEGESGNFCAPEPKEDPMSITVCPHDFIRSDGVCTGCGIVFANFHTGDLGGFANGANHPLDPGIKPDMERIPLPDDVKEKANEIYRRLKRQTHRGKKRKLLVFFCIFNAYAELKTPKDPRHLARLVGLSPHEVIRAFSQFPAVQTGYQVDNQPTSPIDLIPDYCSRLDAELNIPMVEDLAREILSKSRALQEKYPQKVAAGIIQYFMTINGVKYNKKQFAAAMGLSDATISSMFREIAMIHNS